MSRPLDCMVNDCHLQPRAALAVRFGMFTALILLCHIHLLDTGITAYLKRGSMIHFRLPTPLHN